MATKQPNILILWGDDIGWWNISYNSRGQMGYRTPNIDRIANEGVAFTDYYGQQSCTAGRAAFITGQNPVRTGLTKVGMPGADVGLQKEDPTIAELLKPLGVRNGPVRQEPPGRQGRVPADDARIRRVLRQPLPPQRRRRTGTSGLPEECRSSGRSSDPAACCTAGPTARADRKSRTPGPLTKKRMETVDEETTDAALKFIDKTHKDGKPFFVWWNTTAMHFRTHCAEKHQGKSGQGPYNDVMVAHDENVGKMLDKLDELGIADNTIVMYSTDNGPHYNSWPDAGITPFRSEKNTNWEGGWRVPAFVRWPGKIKAGTVLNGIVSHQDWLPTLLAAAGEPDISAKLLNGHKAGDKTFKVHIDGLNMLPYLTGEVKESPRQSFFYISDDGDVLGIRMGDWKMVLAEQRATRMQCWAEPFVKLRLPKMFNLRRDPFERADDNSNTYWDWIFDHAFLLYGMQALVAQQIENFVKYPPRQKAAAFNLDEVMRNLADASGGGHH